MILPAIFNSKWFVYCARVFLFLFASSEFNLQIYVIGPLVLGKSFVYVIYSTILTFTFFNILGNTIFLILVDTSIEEDTCVEPELNVRLCLLCDRGVPPRCTHCEYCNGCVPRRRAHLIILGKCVGYFNHRYYFLIILYSMLYSANAVAIDIIYYNKILGKCSSVVPVDGDLYHEYEKGDCMVLSLFLVSACIHFFILISTIFILTIETEFIITGKLKHEIQTEKYNYNQGLKKNIICLLGERWYMALLCPMTRSKIPDVHSSFYGVRTQPVKFVV